MCDLCGTVEERQAGQRRAARIAEDLERLAAKYWAMSSGSIKPHTDEFKRIDTLACSIVRDLVGEWV